jgi:mono/diheme cytochrome c family protein
VFNTACATCHTLTGHDTPAQGGDLAIAPLSRHTIASFIHIMPVHLARADSAAVAAYIQHTQTTRPQH